MIKHGQQQLSFATFTSLLANSLDDLITNNPKQKGVTQDRRIVKTKKRKMKPVSIFFFLPPLEVDWKVEIHVCDIHVRMYIAFSSFKLEHVGELSRSLNSRFYHVHHSTYGWNVTRELDCVLSIFIANI